MKLFAISVLFCGLSLAGCLTPPETPRTEDLGTSTQEVTECGSEGEHCDDVCAAYGAAFDGCQYGACHCTRPGPAGGAQICERIFGGMVCWYDNGDGKYI